MGLTDRTALEGAPNKALDHSGAAPVRVELCSEPEVLPTVATLQREASRMSSRKDLIAVAAVMLLLVTFALGHISASRKSVAYPDQLGFSAELHDSIVEVKWNPENPAVRDSERGALEIITGSEVNRIELSQAQLRAGQFYVYTAIQTGLKCFFSLYRNENVFVGTTQNVHLSLPQIEAAASLPEQPIDPPPATVEPPIARPSPAQRTSKETSRTKKSRLDRVKRPINRVLVHSPGVSFTPPPVVSTLAPVPRTEDPPALGESELDTADLFPGLPSVASALEQPLTFSAVPIKRVNPTLPRAADLVISQEISIRVAVEIDREGRVSDAHPLNDKDAKERLLATNAVKAARRWRFNPARRDGMPVPSETVLVFQFAKNL
jgi:protein TonB